MGDFLINKKLPKVYEYKRDYAIFIVCAIEEGNGNPLQCSCLENPRDGGAWWAAVYGVAQSWTRLKRLSSILSWERTIHEFAVLLT